MHTDTHSDSHSPTRTSVPHTLREPLRTHVRRERWLARQHGGTTEARALRAARSGAAAAVNAACAWPWRPPKYRCETTCFRPLQHVAEGRATRARAAAIDWRRAAHALERAGVNEADHRLVAWRVVREFARRRQLDVQLLLQLGQREAWGGHRHLSRSDCKVYWNSRCRPERAKHKF